MVRAICCVAGLGLLAGAAEKPAWLSDYKAALGQVRQDDKPLFITFCAGSSAQGGMVQHGPFVSQDVEKSLASGYVRLFVDTDKPEGRALAQHFGTGATPWMVIIDRSTHWQVARQTLPQVAAELGSVLEKFKTSKLEAQPAGQATQASASAGAQQSTSYYTPNGSAGLGGGATQAVGQTYYYSPGSCPNCRR